MSTKHKFGHNHAKAMFYQGLAELGNAVANSSEITQRHLEHGVWGLGDAPASPQPGAPDGRTPILDGFVRDAEAQAKSTRERASREARSPERADPQEPDRS